MIECFNSSAIDNGIIAFLLLGLAVGIMIGAYWADSIHKSRKDLP